MANRLHCDRSMSVLQNPSSTLRSRLLLPLAAVSIAASIAVAIGSYGLAVRASERELQTRYESISSALQTSSFPLNRNVLRSLAPLTGTELLTTTNDGTIVESTLPAQIDSASRVRLSALIGEEASPKKTGLDPLRSVTLGGKQYRVGRFRRTTAGTFASTVIVLFDEANLRAGVTRATLAPLITGLSTVVLLSSLTLVMTSRLVSRVSRLRQQVQKISLGDFETTVVPGPQDEIGQLASSISSMSMQLQQMWRALHQREGERLLHQVASGLAHDLRNHLTGARMAIELHQRKCKLTDDEGLKISIHEIEQTESYVRRLLIVAAGKQEGDQPALVIDCLKDVESSLTASAKHRNIALTWHRDPLANNASVQDGPSLVVALTNLTFNAMQAATVIDVRSMLDGPKLVIDVIDNGPGPDPKIHDSLFEPFITTKQEGLGLGLPLVRRAARRLGGDVSWRRDDSRTVFTLTVHTQ